MLKRFATVASKTILREQKEASIYNKFRDKQLQNLGDIYGKLSVVETHGAQINGPIVAHDNQNIKAISSNNELIAARINFQEIMKKLSVVETHHNSLPTAKADNLLPSSDLTAAVVKSVQKGIQR